MRKVSLEKYLNQQKKEEEYKCGYEVWTCSCCGEHEAIFTIDYNGHHIIRCTNCKHEVLIYENKW